LRLHDARCRGAAAVSVSSRRPYCVLSTCHASCLFCCRLGVNVLPPPSAHRILPLHLPCPAPHLIPPATTAQRIAPIKPAATEPTGRNVPPPSLPPPPAAKVPFISSRRIAMGPTRPSRIADRSGGTQSQECRRGITPPPPDGSPGFRTSCTFRTASKSTLLGRLTDGRAHTNLHQSKLHPPTRAGDGSVVAPAFSTSSPPKMLRAQALRVARPRGIHFEH
jgi:hypothetical protein